MADRAEALSLTAARPGSTTAVGFSSGLTTRSTPEGDISGRARSFAVW
jgi:hypothetical protein